MKHLKDLGIFVRVVEHEGFTAAGRDLGLSASTVSKHVARLEAQLGMRLLHRTTHQVYLTDAGREFYRGCARALADIEEARAAASSLTEGLTGTLRIHATLVLGQSLVAPALFDFMTLHPDIRIELHMGSPGINPMEQQFDIAFRTRGPRDRSLGHSSIRRRRLGPMRYAVVAAPSYLERVGRPRSPDELRDHRGLILTTQSLSDEWFFASDTEEKAVRMTAFLRSNNWLTIRDAAVRGLGIARLAEFAIDDLIRAGHLEKLFAGTVHSDQHVHALFPRTPQTPAKLRLLMDFFVDRFASRL